MREKIELKVGDLIYNEETKVSFILVEYYQQNAPRQYFWKMFSLKSGAVVSIQASELDKEIRKQKVPWVVLSS